MGTHAIVVFADIRGFTRWSEGIEAFQYIDEFVYKFYESLDAHFPGTYLKKLGDGVMIVEKIEREVTSELLVEILAENLDKINHVCIYLIYQACGLGWNNEANHEPSGFNSTSNFNENTWSGWLRCMVADTRHNLISYAVYNARFAFLDGTVSARRKEKCRERLFHYVFYHLVNQHGLCFISIFGI